MLAAMRVVRSFLVATMTLAISVLPVASASWASPCKGHERAVIDCDQHLSGHQAKNHDAGAHQIMAEKASGTAKDGAVDRRACSGQCQCLGLALSAVLATTPVGLGMAIPIVKHARAAESLNDPAFIPPAPPPRL